MTLKVVMNKLIEILRDEISKSDINKENCLDIIRQIENDIWDMEHYILELESKINKLK